MRRFSRWFVIMAIFLENASCGARVAGTDGGVDATSVGAPCEPGAWCRMTPQQRANAINAVFTVSATEAWAAGTRGETMRYLDGRWTSYPRVTSEDLDSIWGSSANDVWAWSSSRVPALDDRRNALVRWDGSQWREVDIGPLPYIRDLDGSAADNVWLATGSRDQGALRRWNGSSFVDVPALPGGIVASVCVRSANEVWATARYPDLSTLLFRFDGTSWTLAYHASSAPDSRLDPVMCPSDGVALVMEWSRATGRRLVEVRNGVAHIDRTVAFGTRFERTPHGDVFRCSQGRADRWTPGGWEDFFLYGTTGAPCAYSFDLLRDGSAGWRFNGSPYLAALRGRSWQYEPRGILQTLVAMVIPGSAPSDPVAVVGDGVWAVPRAGGWQHVQTPVMPDGQLLFGTRAWGADAGPIWVVHAHVGVARYARDTNQLATHPADAPLVGQVLRDLHGSDENNVWAVGAHDVVFRFDGARWARPPEPPPAEFGGHFFSERTFHSVHVASPTDVLISGTANEGRDVFRVLYRWNGTAWSAEFEPEGGSSVYPRMTRDHLGNVYLLNRSRLVRRAASGGAWARIETPSGLEIRDLRANAAGTVDLFAVENRSYVLYELDPRGQWNRVGLPLDAHEVSDLRRGQSGSLWAIGAFGSIYRYLPAR